MRQVVAIVFVLTLPSVAPAAFHFTVTSDPHGYHDTFTIVLDGINSKVGGPGAFHVTVGDLDDTIPENRALITSKLGASAVWYPVVGNHDAETSEDMAWLRDEYNIGHDGRTPLKTYTSQNGPVSARETIYSWDYENAHFVVLNEYWDGASDRGTDGDIVPALYNWLAADLAANTRPFVFVFGHEPAFPADRHIGDSLDKYVSHCDAFWSLLESEGVHTFFSGHTHFYHRYRPGDFTWQVIAGNAGNDDGDGWSFLDVTVDSAQVRYDEWRPVGFRPKWMITDTWTQPAPEPATALLVAVGLAAITRSRRWP